MDRGLADAGDRTQADAGAAADRERRGRVRLLIVEDDRSLREGLALTLRADGYGVVVTAATGEQALRVLEDSPVDIVLTDLHLTGTTGLEVLRAARRSHPDAVVIVITGDPSLPACLEAVRDGAWDCLPKPFTMSRFNGLLARATRYVLDRRDAAAEHPSPEHLVAEFERVYVDRLVQDSAGNLDRAARLARIDRAALDALLAKHGLDASR